MKTVVQLLEDTIMESADKVIAIESYQNKQMITASNEGVYIDVKQALEDEGYRILDTKFKNGDYEIYIAG